MRIEDVEVDQPIYCKSIEGFLLFVPRNIEGKRIFGDSLYIPNEIDEIESMKSHDNIVAEGRELFIKSIGEINDSIFRIREFQPLELGTAKYVIESFFTKKIHIAESDQ